MRDKQFRIDDQREYLNISQCLHPKSRFHRKMIVVRFNWEINIFELILIDLLINYLCSFIE